MAYLTIISPVLTMVAYAPFRNKLAGKPFSNYCSGGLEALIIFSSWYVTKHFEVAPLYLLPCAIGEYVINQLSRIYRELVGAPKKEELEVLVGFIIASVAVLIITSIAKVTIVPAFSVFS